MNIFNNFEILQLSVCGVTFVVGVTVCIYVSIKETIELRQRREAKKLMFEDELRRHMATRIAHMSHAQGFEIQPSHPVPTNRGTVA